jgi:small subunit ribosomal protein S14
MVLFRAKRLDIGCFINKWVIRDHTKRKVFQEYEPERLVPFARCYQRLTLLSRQALRYIIRNTSLPQRTRAQAQLQLSQMHCYTRPTQIKNRCTMGGRGRGVFRAFRMARVSWLAVCGAMTNSVQFQFRMNALEGKLVGVRKASW